MAQKRALGSAIKGAANVSEHFTVDLEDLYRFDDVVEGQVIIEKPAIPFEIVKTTPEPEAEQGEIVEEAPAKGEPWTQEEATTWVHAQMAKGHSDVELRTALVVSQKWSEWDGSVEDADKALAAYVKAQMDAAQKDNARPTGKLAAAPSAQEA